MSEIKLPATYEATMPALEVLTTALGVSRDVLASDEQIKYAWRELPREINKIPKELRNDILARMCIATATGLFDGAINYAWNAAIIQLREKVRLFGLNVISQILDKEFDENALLDYQDANLLSLCFQLNLITEEGYFFLDQNRCIRNNYSAAHPTTNLIDDRELISFISRCVKYALSTSISPKGVDISQFIAAIKGIRFEKSQIEVWISRLIETHDPQREILLGMLHGIYCDPSSSEQIRLNSLDLCLGISDKFTPNIKSNLIDRHSEYVINGDDPRRIASQQFFEKLNLLKLLDKAELHHILSLACSRMMSVHQGFNNFYNEPPFAERLLEISSQGEIPDSIKYNLVLTVMTCYIGNGYGVSNAAVPIYESLIKGFTPVEIKHLLQLPDGNTVFSSRYMRSKSCNDRYHNAVRILDPVSIPTSLKGMYEDRMSSKN